MIYVWFTGINYYKLAVEKDRDSIFTTITLIWKPCFRRKVKYYSSHLKGSVDGNYRVYILYTFIKPNQEQLQKMQLYIYVGPLAGNEPAIPVQRL